MRVAQVAVLGALGTGLAARVAADPLDGEGSPHAGRAAGWRRGTIEATGFVGIDYFGSHTALGNSVEPEQIPLTSPMGGARLTYLALPRLGAHVALGGELELGFTPAFTGYGFQARRPSYFAPVIAWRGSILARYTAWSAIRPHVLIGAGGETIRSDSPFMAKDTDAVVYWGLGATFPVLDRWQVRFDARQGIMSARDGGTTSTFEVLLGVGGSFGIARGPAHAGHVEIGDARERGDGDRDGDGDGIPDRLDACPDRPETVNGFQDADGCPEPDADGDGIPDANDRCPNEPEDIDHFQDEDGCPDPDNDGDGIPDTRDACPDDPETFNLFEDDDGCPDRVPDVVTNALEAASTVKFDRGRVRITAAGEQALQGILGVLRERGTLHVVVIGHPAASGDKEAELAKKRAEAVKWFLVEQGAAQDQVATVIGGAAIKHGPVIEIQLAASPPKPSPPKP